MHLIIGLQYTVRKDLQQLGFKPHLEAENHQRFHFRLAGYKPATNVIQQYYPQIPMLAKNQQFIEMQNKHYRTTKAKELEGQCRVHTIELLSFSYVKSLTLGLLTIVSVVGAILLYNFKKFRKIVFYSASTFSEASHVYISTQDGNDDIERIFIVDNFQKQFCFKKLRYWLTESGEKPVSFHIQSEESANKDLNSLVSLGLSMKQVHKRREIYGFNEHTVDTPNYFAYMASVIFTPLYLLQYLVVVSLSLQGLPLMGIILVLVSLLTTSGNYIALYMSNKKIKEIAEKKHTVRALRDKLTVEIDSRELVPGDIFFVQRQMTCDSVLVNGEAYMNEHSMTGESVPVGKFMINDVGGIWPDNRWLFEGTVNLEAGEQTKAMVIHTGFATRKGRIIRQMLNRVPKQPDFFQKAVIFLIFSGILSLILYFATVQIKLSANIDRPLVWLSIINFILNAIPPAFPIYFTMAYSWSIYRLKSQGILTTMPEKTVQSNRLKICCFDKTGTLTQNNILLHEIYIYDERFKLPGEVDSNSWMVRWMMALFGTCHTVRDIGGNLMGDEVDLRMFEYSKYKKHNTSEGECYVDSSQNTYQIIKVHQFESKYQSMAVLVHDKAANKYFCFSKGAPEKMMSFATNKIDIYDAFVADLALKGLRTIAMNIKQIKVQEVETYKNGPREHFSADSKLIGLVTFQNKLKHDTSATLAALKDAEIDCKMITGDGIFIAVETAMRAGIVNQNDIILVIEGRKQEIAIPPAGRTIKGLYLKKVKNQYIQENTIIQEQKLQELKDVSIAVDNDFLNINPPYSLHTNMKIFARIVPENKAKIIKLFKQQMNQKWQSRTFRERLFGQGKAKVSMTGDGANDLLAIREADVGIGISDSDASYGASFTLQDLNQQIDIIKEGKCTTQNIVQNLRYVLIVNYLNIVVDILCSTQATFLSMMMALYFNFFMITTLPIISAFSKPDPNRPLTPRSVQDNFFGLENHLLTWGNILILASGLLGGFFYTTGRSDYITNSDPFYIFGVGYHPDCQLVTSMFLLMGIPLATTSVLVYKSHPWKNTIYKNIVLTIVIIVNIIIMIVFYAANNQIAGLFGTVYLPLIVCLFLFLISTGSQVLAFIYNMIIIKRMHPEYDFIFIETNEATKETDATKLNMTLMSEPV